MKYKSFYFKFLTFFLKKPMIRKFGEKSTKESLKKAKPVYREMIEKTETSVRTILWQEIFTWAMCLWPFAEPVILNPMIL